ncbi:TPA: hypothetical protein ACF2DD_002120 [Clostridium perfringens]
MEESSKVKNINIEFEAVNSNNGDGFCWDIDEKTFVNIMGRKPFDCERSDINKGLYSIDPDDIYYFGNTKCKIKLSVEVIEE